MRQEMAEATRVEQVPQEKRMVSPWLLTTKWHEHVAGYDVAALRMLVALPKADDHTMPNLMQAVEEYFESALVLLDITDELILQRLNSPDPLKDGINNSPLHRHQEDTTMKSYIRSTVGLLAMLLRADGSQDYEVPITHDLMQAVQHLELALREGEQTAEKIHAVLTIVWMTKWVKGEDNTIPCPTERFMILHTLEVDGRHKEPVLITPDFARVEYCMRLACLKQLKVLSAEVYNGNDEAACDALQPWFTEKTGSPFSGIRSLQHRASSIAYNTVSLPRVWWVDRRRWMEMLYRGNKVHIDDLREIFASMEEKMVDLWENKVLAGIKMRVCYDNIVDDISNHDVGYCFLSDRRNTCFKDRDRFLKALISDPKHFAQFAVMRQGKLVWNRSTLLQWLGDYADFQKLVLARCEMLSGAPGRGTELTAMTYRNTKTRSQRNLVMLGKNLTMLRTYHKGTALTGTDKLIPHSIDGVTADIMIQDLALTRPFAEVAAYICYPDKPWIKEFYQKQIFINNDMLFTTENLSATMKRECMLKLGFSMTVNPWRHISTAFRRKLGRFAEELLEDDDEDTIEALQAGHSRATENRIYGLSPDMLAGGAEDLLPLFLQASTNWQLLMRTVPGGLQLAYTDARAIHFQQLAESGRFASDFEDPPPNKVPGLKADIRIDTEDMVCHMVRKLEDRFMAGMEQRLTDRMVDALTPVLEGVIKEAVKAAIPPQPAVIPTNDLDFDDIYGEASSQGPEQGSSKTPKAKGKPYCNIQHKHKLIRPLLRLKDTGNRISHNGLATIKIILNNSKSQWISPEQREAVIATLKRETDVIAMLRTGGGKSMLAILPAIMEIDKAVVVVLPLKSLMTDWERKLTAMRIPYQVYDQTQPLSPGKNLILVSADKARFKTWRQYLAELNEILPVSRIIFDEAHLALLSEDFRLSMRNLHEIRQFAMQIILLSGSMPLLSVPALRELFGLLLTTVEIRQCSNRPELEYIMEPPAQSHTLAAKVIQIVEKEQLGWTAKDRGLIFVTYIEDGKNLSRRVSSLQTTIYVS
ncbi:uncharacterized protein EDB93DRAFT_1096999 [Suillus bovinus]|uniref:uncharacterized protein n=1 Tax=Suillus bovinus TaxID=48563 RepID=UPI001B87ED91|nr:uncharacterized protein EDB93DRAFT_1096999 [Suillus bovinus]KAG2126628.1 hypothetical protein EDB93DRAFT_1096999 [Suillus bovinus]